MKRIEFGFSNDKNPSGLFEGIGINPHLLLCDADYYGTISYEGNNYLIAKVTEDVYNNYPHLLNNFIVRRALCDLFADGSCTLMLDQKEDVITHLLERHLNKPGIKDKINNMDDIYKYCDGIGMAPKSFKLLELDSTILATSITTEAFEDKKHAIDRCHLSMSQLQQEVSENYRRK